MEFLRNVCLAHLQLLMNTSAKYQANWTEILRVVRTRFCGQTDSPTDRQADSSIPATNFVCRGLTINGDDPDLLVVLDFIIF